MDSYSLSFFCATFWKDGETHNITVFFEIIEQQAAQKLNKVWSLYTQTEMLKLLRKAYQNSKRFNR